MLKIKSNLILITSSLLVLSLTNCKVDEGSSPLISTDENVKKDSNLKSASNSITDDLEYIGIVHNAIVDEVGYTNNFHNLTNSAIETIVVDAAEIEISGYEDDGTYEYELQPDKKLSTLASDFGFSTDAVNFMVDIEDEVITLLSDTTRDTLTYVSNLKAIENNIFNSTLLLEEKKYLIGSSIMARYSGVYWQRVGLNSSHPWNNVSNYTLSDYNLASDYETTILNGNNNYNSSSVGPWFRVMWDLTAFSNYSSDCGNFTGASYDGCVNQCITWSSSASVHLL